jgi:hypothetical protein
VPVWILIYAISAAWCGWAAYLPAGLLAAPQRVAAFVVCLAPRSGDALYMWPASVSDWWDNELVREGLRLIVVTAALVVAGWRARRATLAAA